MRCSSLRGVPAVFEHRVAQRPEIGGGPIDSERLGTVAQCTERLGALRARAVSADCAAAAPALRSVARASFVHSPSAVHEAARSGSPAGGSSPARTNRSRCDSYSERRACSLRSTARRSVSAAASAAHASRSRVRAAACARPISSTRASSLSTSFRVREVGGEQRVGGPALLELPAGRLGIGMRPRRLFDREAGVRRDLAGFVERGFRLPQLGRPLALRDLVDGLEAHGARFTGNEVGRQRVRGVRVARPFERDFGVAEMGVGPFRDRSNLLGGRGGFCFRRACGVDRVGERGSGRVRVARPLELDPVRQCVDGRVELGQRGLRRGGCLAHRPCLRRGRFGRRGELRDLARNGDCVELGHDLGGAAGASSASAIVATSSWSRGRAPSRS